MAKIVIDFGSSNSGACINWNDTKEYQQDNLKFAHRNDRTGQMKQPTEFWIKKSLLDREYDSIKDSDFRILSCIGTNTETIDPNVIWTRSRIIENIDTLFDTDNDWIRFSRFKMNLYNGNGVVKGSDGNDYELGKIAKLFFRIMKLDCLSYIDDNSHLDENQINWGFSIPALWDDKQREEMRTWVNSVFPNSTLLSEPECGLVGMDLLKTGKLTFNDGDITLCVDAGGGTTDFVLVKTIKKDIGKFVYRQIAESAGRAAGGNEMDDRFWAHLALAFHNEFTGVNLDVFEKFMDESKKAFMEMEDDWEKQKTHFFDSNDVIFSYKVSPGFAKWLVQKGGDYQSLGYKLKDDFLVIKLDREEMEKVVFLPVINKIEKAVAEFCEKTNKIDRLVLAGGLSLNKLVFDSVIKVVKSYFPEAEVQKMQHEYAQAAIMIGGLHLLLNDRLMERVATKTFFTKYVTDAAGDRDKILEEITNKIILAYNRLEGFEIINSIFRIIQIRKKVRDDSGFLELTNDTKHGRYYSPICIKGAPAYDNHIENMLPSIEGQTHLKFDIYSLPSKEIIVFPGKKIENLKLEGSMEYVFGEPWEKASVEIDFNSSPNSGVAIFILRDKDGNELVRKPVDNVTKKGL